MITKFTRNFTTKKEKHVMATQLYGPQRKLSLCAPYCERVVLRAGRLYGRLRDNISKIHHKVYSDTLDSVVYLLTVYGNPYTLEGALEFGLEDVPEEVSTETIDIIKYSDCLLQQMYTNLYGCLYPKGEGTYLTLKVDVHNSGVPDVSADIPPHLRRD